MEGWTLILVIVAIVAAVLGGVIILFPYLIKRGFNVESTLSNAVTAIDTADLVVDGLTGVFPGMQALTVVDKIIDYARKAVEAAEQMYKACQIEANERKHKAQEIIYDCLKVAEIEVTPDIEKVVTGLIEAAAFGLPKTNVEAVEAGKVEAEQPDVE